jgi:hypothetical protein
MNKPKKTIEMGFTNEYFPESCHICLIYDSEEQRQKIVAEYLAAGIKQGEYISYFADQTTFDKVRFWLKGMAIEIPQDENNELMKFINALSYYNRDGKFEPEKIIEGVEQRYDNLKQKGYSGSRATGEMSWAIREGACIDRLLEYEVLLNKIDHPFPHTGMCQYDARLFDGATLFKVLQLHPYMIAHGQIVRNPFYIKPTQTEKR